MLGFGKVAQAVANRNGQGPLAVSADDAVFLRHPGRTGTTMARFGRMIRKQMTSDDMGMGRRRLIFETDHRRVVHLANDAPAGTRAAVPMACTLSHGETGRMETGATPPQT